MKNKDTTSGVLMNIPLPEGTFEIFAVYETEIMAPELAAKFPDIKTYAGNGIKEKTSNIRLDFNPNGFPAMLITLNGTVIIDRAGLVNVGPSPAFASIVFTENSTYENIVQIAGGIAFGPPGTYGLWIDPTCAFNGGEESVNFALEKFMFGIGGLGGVSPDSLFFKSRLCFMQRDTHIFGSLFFHNPVQTTFSAVDTPVKAQGETTDRLSRGWNHAYNQLSYLLTNPLKCSVEVKAYLTAEASVTNASIYIAKNGVIDPDSRCQVYIPTEGAIAVTDGIYDVDAGDYFEIWVENNANTWSINQWVQLEDKATRMKITTM